MWDEIVGHLPEFSGAVLTGCDAEGYPFSVRCHPTPDASRLVLRLSAPPSVPIRSGPASLLCHKHDEWLWHQRSFLVRGKLERESETWIFIPERYVAGVGYGGVQGQVRFIIGARHAARRYLAVRRLPRPNIPWDEMEEIKRQALVNVAAKRALVAPIIDAPPPRRLDPPGGAPLGAAALDGVPARSAATQARAPRLGLTLAAGGAALLVAFVAFAALWWWRRSRG
jgi:hypothetical protein